MLNFQRITWFHWAWIKAKKSSFIRHCSHCGVHCHDEKVISDLGYCMPTHYLPLGLWMVSCEIADLALCNTSPISCYKHRWCLLWLGTFGIGIRRNQAISREHWQRFWTIGFPGWSTSAIHLAIVSDAVFVSLRASLLWMMVELDFFWNSGTQIGSLVKVIHVFCRVGCEWHMISGLDLNGFGIL